MLTLTLKLSTLDAMDSDSLRAGRSGDRIPVGAKSSATVLTGFEAHPVSYTMCTGSLPGVNRLGRGIDHPPPRITELKKEYNCTPPPPLGLRGLFWGEVCFICRVVAKLCVESA